VLKDSVIDALRAAGLVPLLLPPGEPDLDAALHAVQGVVITGGAFDIDPAHYGQTVVTRVDAPKENRTATELELARICVQRDVPLLGICGGMQALAVALGGTLVQDIGTQVHGAMEHEQPTDPATGWHRLRTSGGVVGLTLGRHPVVNSTHHQAVDDPGPLRVTAVADDGVIEAVEAPDRSFCVGVQWHPELLPGCAPLFKAYAQALRGS
jgi:putative glutamine amidotransferase